jgi:HK97 family phage major capsid protein
MRRPPRRRYHGSPDISDMRAPSLLETSRSATSCAVRGVAVQRLEELQSDNGQIGFRAFERVDGRVILADALRILINSAT